jgi:hypothetical protein
VYVVAGDLNLQAKSLTGITSHSLAQETGQRGFPRIAIQRMSGLREFDPIGEPLNIAEMVSAAVMRAVSGRMDNPRPHTLSFGRRTPCAGLTSMNTHAAEFWQERRADDGLVGGRVRPAKGEHGRVIKISA